MYLYPEAVLVDTWSGDVVSTGPDGEFLTFADAEYLAARLAEQGFSQVKPFTLTPGTPAQTPGARMLAGDAA